MGCGVWGAASSPVRAGGKCLRVRELTALVPQGREAGVPGVGSLGRTACSPLSYGLVEQGGDVLFLVPVGRTEHHHPVLEERASRVSGRTEAEGLLPGRGAHLPEGRRGPGTYAGQAHTLMESA